MAYSMYVQCKLYFLQYLIQINSSSPDEVNEININDPIRIPDAAKSRLFM